MSDIRMPDGQVVRFPDDMPKNQIRGMIEKKYPDAFKPSSLTGDVETDVLTTITGEMTENFPIVGPYIRSGIDKLTSAVTGQSEEDIEQRNKQLVERMPELATGSQVAGAVAGTAPMIAAAPGLFGVGTGNLALRTAASSASGGVIGGGDAAVRSGGDVDATISGAKWGFGFGMGAPLLAKGVGTLFSKVFGRAPATKADKLVAKALEREGITGEEAIARLKALGDDAMPADIGPAFREHAEGLASMPGKAQVTVRGALNDRAANAGQRVVSATDEALGQPANTLQTADDIIQQRTNAARPLYDQAYKQPLPQTSAIQEVLSTPAGKTAWARAQRLASNEGIPINIDAPDVRSIDLVKRSLDDMIDVATRKGSRNEARILTGMRDRLVSSVDEAVPEYAAAREAFAGPSAVLDAMESGKNVFANKVSPAELQRTLQTMGQSEREAFTQGAREAVANIMGTARSDANAARAMFEKGFNREKLSLLIGDEQAQSLFSRLDAERTFMNTRNQITGSSRTAPRQQVIRELGGQASDAGPIAKAMNLQFGDATKDVGGRIARAFNRPGIEKRNEALAQALMDRTNGSEFVNSIRRLRAVPDASKTDAMIEALAIGGGPAVAR